MSYEVKYSPVFERAIKRLAKKYPSVRKDLAALIEELSETPFVGSPLGKDCYKVRMAIRSKGKGRSGGARVITCVKVVRNTVICSRSTTRAMWIPSATRNWSACWC